MQLADITVGSDENLYFTEHTGNIGEITTGGDVTMFPVSPAVHTTPDAITSGPDGNIWFTDPGDNSIGVLTLNSLPPPPPPPPPPGTMTMLQATRLSPVYGQQITLSAAVSPQSGSSGMPTGTVTFSDQNAELGSAQLIDGNATLPVSDLPVGTDAITASYGGESPFGPSTSAAVDVTVGKDRTLVSLRFSATTAVMGQTIIFTAAVSPQFPGGGTPTGSVTFYNGATDLGSATLIGSTATLLVDDLPVGTDAITASYNGDPDFVAETLGQVVRNDYAPTQLQHADEPEYFATTGEFRPERHPDRDRHADRTSGWNSHWHGHLLARFNESRLINPERRQGEALDFDLASRPRPDCRDVLRRPQFCPQPITSHDREHPEHFDKDEDIFLPENLYFRAVRDFQSHGGRHRQAKGGSIGFGHVPGWL